MANDPRAAVRPVAFLALAGLALLCASSGAGADPNSDPWAQLPALKPPELLMGGIDRSGEHALVAGVAFIPGRAVILAGQLWLDQGPEEGLAVVASMPRGRLHESLIRLDTSNAMVVKGAIIAAFGWSDGITADLLHGYPPRGRPVRVTVEWQGDDGRTVSTDASCLIRDRDTDRIYPPLPFVYTGSRVATVRYAGTDGVARERTTFMLSEHHTVVAVYDEDEALISTPLIAIADDVRFEVATRLVPAIGTRLSLVFTPGQSPLELHVREDGSFAESASGPPLDDTAVGRLLAAHCANLPGDALHSVSLLVRRSFPRSQDAAISRHLLALAARAQCWVAPVLVPDDS